MLNKCRIKWFFVFPAVKGNTFLRLKIGPKLPLFYYSFLSSEVSTLINQDSTT